MRSGFGRPILGRHNLGSNSEHLPFWSAAASCSGTMRFFSFRQLGHWLPLWPLTLNSAETSRVGTGVIFDNNERSSWQPFRRNDNDRDRISVASLVSISGEKLSL